MSDKELREAIRHSHLCRWNRILSDARLWLVGHRGRVPMVANACGVTRQTVYAWFAENPLARRPVPAALVPCLSLVVPMGDLRKRSAYKPPVGIVRLVDDTSPPNNR